MRVLHVMSCRGWSSDAYWAARMTVELERAGHQVTLACRRGTEDRVISRARAAGVTRLDTLTLAGGVDPAGDAADVRRLRDWLGRIDVVHTHRGKEHWLAALANRLSGSPRPLVRTRHIVQPVRAHALNRWLYRRATALVVTVTEAIRRQYLAAGLAQPERVVALPGGVDATAWRPDRDGRALRASLGVPDDVPLIGLLGGFRVMKGHAVALAAAAELARRGRPFHLALVGRGNLDLIIRTQRARLGLADRVTIVDSLVDAAATVAGFDIALYVPLESDGMSRVLFEYLAAGRPLVASRVGVVPEVLADGEHALLVPA
ncbi:MAG TPA: glycosyltransferase, partial [Methylomirabilota bacterium]|nr:glycosyltransferase [Methylomirabilota bacterium]